MARHDADSPLSATMHPHCPGPPGDSGLSSCSNPSVAACANPALSKRTNLSLEARALHARQRLRLAAQADPAAAAYGTLADSVRRAPIAALLLALTGGIAFGYFPAVRRCGLSGAAALAHSLLHG